MVMVNNKTLFIYQTGS